MSPTDVEDTETRMERRGFIALGKIAGIRRQDSLQARAGRWQNPKPGPHHLLRATRAHSGQIFIVVFHPKREIEARHLEPGRKI